MTTSCIQSLAEQIKTEAQESSSNGYSHSHLLQLVDELKLVVETPTETILRLIYQPPENAALRTVVDFGIFPILINSLKEEGILTTDIAVHTGANRGLVSESPPQLKERRLHAHRYRGCLMRVITSLGLCLSIEAEVYHPSEKTLAMTKPIGRDGVPCIYDLTVPALSNLPEYLRLNNYKNPGEYSKSPMQWAVGKSQFEWLDENKKHQSLFNSLTEGAICKTEAIFFVDIGGNEGHDLEILRARYSSLPGRLLQDLPRMVKNVDKKGIETMAYSFLDQQPVRNARAYYFRAVFHDWPDKICKRILLNTISAKEAQYSRIIIVDFVLPDTNVPRMQSAMDIQIMSIGAGVERSRKQWIDPLASVGLKLHGIWNTNPAMESIIEAVPIQESEEHGEEI
ncbi:hypothetical protein N7520_004331 [Penicillium odoratum]|uniref:uncharacterized protein n=1 Tax=Penicillium odoratum TaxID=1167516 RepID=UPI0025496ECB|nr:uncharacterized protein N7520_004331 [Penicillium odoratum]KAJ5764772.1 hypothetical protein N7520_004331 [Penicillium odoratum]